MAEDRPVELTAGTPEAIAKENAVLWETLKAIEKAKKEWEQSMDCLDDIVIVVDLKDNIRRCNRALISIAGKPYTEILSRKWQEVLKECGFTHHLSNSGDIEFFHPAGKWFNYNLCAVRDAETVKPYSAVITLNDITDIRKLTQELIKNREAVESANRNLDDAYTKLKAAQSQILQQEKMSSIGQLAAGIAHEINNPVGFVMSNLGSLQKYSTRLCDFIKIQTEALEELKEDIKAGPQILERVKDTRRALKVDYLTEDIGSLIRESYEGAERVKHIVEDLKNFSRIDEAEYLMADINAGIESTIHIVWNELKYKVTLKKELGPLPLTKCNPGQLNQVIMNILINAAHAIETQGEITIKTWEKDGSIYVTIADTGSGIEADKIDRIFEPFFTTKEVGKGTGLGLSIAYDIIKKHHGDISVESRVGQGTRFTLKIPVVEK